MSDAGTKRKQQTTRALIRLRQLLDHLEGNKTKTSEALGVSPGTVSDWVKKGEMPFVADLACEGLLRRLGSTLKQTEILVARGPMDKLEAVLAMTIALKGHVVDSMSCVQTDEYMAVLHAPADVAGLMTTMIAHTGGKTTKGGTSL